MESFEELTRAKQANQETLLPSQPTPQPSNTLDDDRAGALTKVDAQIQPQLSALDEAPALYPPLSDNLPKSFKNGDGPANDDDEEPRMATSFEGEDFSASEVLETVQKPDEKVDDDHFSRLRKFILYETMNNFYLVGSDLLDTSFRIMKIDRTADPGELNVAEDEVVYTKKETHQLLKTIDEGNKGTGGLKQKVAFWGLLGFIRFTGPFYMIVVTKRAQVAMLGGHYIYQIEATELIPITTQSYSRAKPDRYPEESRFINILNSLDLTKAFYFSHSYDVTRTLQFNIMREREALQQGLSMPNRPDHNDMFVWNHHLLIAAKEVLRNPFDWCLAIVHGYVDQSALSIYWGRIVYVTIIARRSRFFAGARYLKRGANDLGYVANDVETEQIVSEMLTTSFHAPGPVLFANPHYTSYVQHRGSIPLYWSQDTSGVQPKPDIHLNVIDPFFTAAAMHFDNLFERYGAPIFILDLVKARERTPRESKLLKEYTAAIAYLNQFLPQDKRIIHHAWDMSRASKSRDQDVIGTLEEIADDVLPRTGFFRNGNDVDSGLQMQNGIVRTNCIDCLDRTNAAQFVVGKKALGYQLQALGIIEHPLVEYDSDSVNLFTHMWHDHGDTIAVQYGGSHLVNTMQTYRKINQWTSQSRDMVESFKRFYNNSFLDAQRQEAYNLFLGNYVFVEGQPMLWDLSTDYYLHHSDPRSMLGKLRPNYREWFTPANLQNAHIPPSIMPGDCRAQPVEHFDDYWTEYYRPLAMSSFKKIFSFRMHSNLRYIPFRSIQEGKYDLSPFRVRTAQDGEDSTAGKKNTVDPNARRKGVKFVSHSDESSTIASQPVVESRVTSPSTAGPTPTDRGAPPLATETQPKFNTLGHWLDAQQQLHGSHRTHPGIMKEASFEVSTPDQQFLSDQPSYLPPLVPYTFTQTTETVSFAQPQTKAEKALAAFTTLVARTLRPEVDDAEMREYDKYVRHPLELPLVYGSPSTQPDGTDNPQSWRRTSKPPPEFVEYLAKVDSRVADEYAGVVVATTMTTTTTHAASPPLPSSSLDQRAELSADAYADFLEVRPREGLEVLPEDAGLKRYKRYRQWVRGKSLFKQKDVLPGLGIWA